MDTKETRDAERDAERDAIAKVRALACGDPVIHALYREYECGNLSFTHALLRMVLAQSAQVATLREQLLEKVTRQVWEPPALAAFDYAALEKRIAAQVPVRPLFPPRAPAAVFEADYASVEAAFGERIMSPYLFGQFSLTARESGRWQSDQPSEANVGKSDDNDYSRLLAGIRLAAAKSTEAQDKTAKACERPQGDTQARTGFVPQAEPSSHAEFAEDKKARMQVLPVGIECRSAAEVRSAEQGAWLLDYATLSDAAAEAGSVESAARAALPDIRQVLSDNYLQGSHEEVDVTTAKLRAMSATARVMALVELKKTDPGTYAAVKQRLSE